MELREVTVDDLLYGLYQVLSKGRCNVQSRRGASTEVLLPTLCLGNPRSRLSRSATRGRAITPLVELLWYLSGSGSLEFIKFYIPTYPTYTTDGSNDFGAYGPRLFNKNGKINQIESVVNLLKRYPHSRRAVIQIFDASDLDGDHNEVPCTCSLQFFIRDEKLIMHTHMRSNDAYMGLPHDVFTFTMIQEIISCRLGLEIGEYYHTAGSMHLYKSDGERIKMFLEEGFQPTDMAMPEMPADSVEEQIKLLLVYEEKLRSGDELDISAMGLNPYWTDLAILLAVLVYSRRNDLRKVEILLDQITHDYYRIYIMDKIQFMKEKDRQSNER